MDGEPGGAPSGGVKDSPEIQDSVEILVVDDGKPHVGELLEEFKQAGVMPNGFYDIAVNQEVRRMIWAGQSPDGRKWDEMMPEGEPARPWDGASDARVAMVDMVCNADTAVNCAAFQKAELRATALDPDQADQAASVSEYLHWMVHTKYRRMLRPEVELSTQYSREHGWCVAYVGWERELGKRKMKVTLEALAGFVQQMAAQQQQQGQPGAVQQDPNQAPGQQEAQMFMASIMDPNQEDAAAEQLAQLFTSYVQQSLADKGFFPEEEKAAELKPATALRVVRELREDGEATVPIPYVVKNGPLAWVLTPYLEFMAARGTMRLQQARAVFWRRWMTDTELESKRAEGWDEDWIEAVKKTKGNISSWAGALGAVSLTGPSTKTVGNTTYLKVTEENNPLIEVVYAYVKKADDDGITSVWETIFSPHVTKLPKDAGKEVDTCAKHELLDYAHGRYPFVEYKRENIGRALTDTRSVAEVASTWQAEEKNQRDMLFNRSQWDTLPPVRVPKMGGADYKLGPWAQVPMNRTDVIEALNLNAPEPKLALELVQDLRLMADKYFGQFNQELSQATTGAQQQKSVGDFYAFWGDVFMQMFALVAQYNPGEIVKVTGNQALGQLDPQAVCDQFMFGMEFDVQELNPDYLMQKLEAIHGQVLPADAGGVIDRSALTNLELKMLDPRLAAKVIQDKAGASQQTYREVDTQTARMALGNEAEYTENDPTAGAKLQFLQQVMASNPKYQQWAKSDKRFQELLQNYAKNLQMSITQQQNAQVGRIGVKPVGPGGAGAGMGSMGAMPGQMGGGQ